MSPAMTSYSWHPEKTGRYAISIVMAAVALCGWVATRSEPQEQPLILACTFAVVALAAALHVDHDTCVDADARTVVRESRLFGRFRVWLWHYPLSEFTGVAMQRESDPGEGSDTVFVGLRQRSGRLMWVCYFHAGVGKPCVEAELVARSLADATGLQLHKDVA